MSNSKRDIRFVGFVSTDDGGRRFDFFVSSPDQQQVAVSVDIPGILFAGSDRIKVQEGASICSAKIRELYGLGGVDSIPARLLLTGHDITQLREQPKAARRLFQRT